MPASSQFWDLGAGLVHGSRPMLRIVSIGGVHFEKYIMVRVELAERRHRFMHDIRAAGHSTSAPKRKAPIDEDLFAADDDDDDDAPAHRHATADMAPTVDEAASSATGAPPARKRMKAPRRM